MRPVGPQCFVDWRFVKAGFVGWYSGGSGAGSDHRVGVWEPAANPVGRPAAPFGIRLRAQPAQETEQRGKRNRCRAKTVLARGLIHIFSPSHSCQTGVT